MYLRRLISIFLLCFAFGLGNLGLSYAQINPEEEAVVLDKEQNKIEKTQEQKQLSNKKRGRKKKYNRSIRKNKRNKNKTNRISKKEKEDKEDTLQEQNKEEEKVDVSKTAN